MKTLILSLLAIFALGCGKTTESASSKPFDSNACPSGEYGMIGYAANFLASGNVTLETNFCTSSGTYTCDPATRALRFTLTAQEGGALASECEPVGSVTCRYEYGRDSRGFLQLLVTCPGSSKLNATVTFETTRSE
jgi:hypothetical protein